MCGIIGIIHKNKSIQTESFEAGFFAIKNRGREEYIYDLSPSERYGYHRLPTDGLDKAVSKKLSRGKLPLCLFNGIITNIDQLISEFKLNPQCRSSDTQTLAEGFQKHGIPFLNRCRGMFAFAHITKDAITLSRDSIGIKPLYYIFENDTFVFASEMKALLPFSDGGIQSVQPGEIISFDKRSFSISKDRITYRPTTKKYSLEELLVRSLIEPTRRYLQQTTKPIGLLLSGGLDSSLLLGLFAKHLDRSEFQRVQCFSIGKPDADDSRATTLLGYTFGISLQHVILPSDKECLDMVQQIVHAVESPYARVVKVAFLQDALAKEIKRAGIDVIVSGEGADELFYGYRKFIDGLTFPQIDEVYKTFLTEMFPQTLLQRLDRIFARHCIEGRVPFLDQDLVAYAMKLPAHKKMLRTESTLVVKVPLRKLARTLGVPQEIADREKMPMLHGSTTQTNTENESGFLEEYCQKKLGMSCSKLVEKIYMDLYGHTKTVDRLTGSATFDMRTKELSLALSLRERKSVHKTAV